VTTLSHHEARSRAREKLASVAMGADPSGERHKLSDAITVAEFCDLYLLEAKGRIKASTLVMDRSRIETHVKPLLGRQSLTSLTTEDIERMQFDIAAGKTAQPRRLSGRGGVAHGGPVVAARTVGMLATILEVARRRKVISENPAREVPRLPEGRQRRFLDLDEIALLGAALRDDEEVGKNRTAVAAIRFLLLTGLRRMEALALPWAWVDRRGRCLRFGDTKSGPQFRPIGGEAVNLLERQPVREGCPWVFPAERGDGHFVGLPKVLVRICAKAGLSGVTIHVLRHSFASAAAEMGYSGLMIAGLLGHSVPGVTARYAHLPDWALVDVADRVSDEIAAALDRPRGGISKAVSSSFV
jgi:integrase